MSMESLFRIALRLIFGGMIIMQVYFASWLRLAGEHKSMDINLGEKYAPY